MRNRVVIVVAFALLFAIGLIALYGGSSLAPTATQPAPTTQVP